MPHPKIALSGQAREIRKNRLKKVAKYKLHSQHKKALRGAAALEPSLQQGAPSWQQQEAQLEPTQALPEPRPGQQPWRAADGSRISRAPKQRKPPKVSAVAAARSAWERSQVDVIAAREAARVAAAERREEQEAARKRRSEQTSKLKKRTKRGQPVLGNMVDRFLSKLEGGPSR